MFYFSVSTKMAIDQVKGKSQIHIYCKEGIRFATWTKLSISSTRYKCLSVDEARPRISCIPKEKPPTATTNISTPSSFKLKALNNVSSFPMLDKPSVTRRTFLGPAGSKPDLHINYKEIYLVIQAISEIKANFQKATGIIPRHLI